MKNLLYISPIVLFGLFHSINVQAQRMEDVVYLRNGSIIHGIILKDSTGNTVRILNHSGDTWVFNRSDVDSITREKPFEYKAKQFNQPGFEFNINALFLMRSHNNAIGNAVIPGVSVGLGYKINPYFSAGAEIGMEFYDWMEVPLSATLRVRSSRRALSPLAYLSAGYTFPAEKRKNDWDYRYESLGGVNSTIGIGVERIISENASFLFTFSYHYQELNYHLTPLHQWVQERDRTESYSRLRLTLGYVFK